jgi:hypothetical protein
MNRAALLLGGVLALTSVWAVAQDAPESLLPPGFDQPAPRPTRAAPGAPAAGATSAPRNAPQAAAPSSTNAGSPAASAALPKNLPPLKALEGMTPEQIDELLGLKPKFDMPPAARRSMEQVGLMDSSEGGMPVGSLAGQDGTLVRAALAGNNGQLVSRWGHVLLRRALASRLAAPAGLDPADFAALRAALLVRMGEGDVARALVQDVDAGNYTPDLTQAALDAYLATADITGACPMVLLQGSARKDKLWEVWRSICGAFNGDESASLAQLDRQLYYGALPKIDMMLAQKYAGAGGQAKRAVSIEWDGVNDMNPFRYALAIATGVEVPDGLLRGAGRRYAYTAALAPMLGLPQRAAAADTAGGAGILSSAAMVDLYSQIWSAEDISGDWSERADRLREAYVGQTPAERLASIKALWAAGNDPAASYSRRVLTAYAAARMPPSEDLAGDAAGLIASMLAAGLDANALRWANVVDKGSEAWALLALADGDRKIAVDGGALDSFAGDDSSPGSRKTAFLLAGLAGLGKISGSTGRNLAGSLDLGLERHSKWTRLIDQAAATSNPELVCLLAGLGMQGDGWDKMTPRYLFHIVSALNRVGLGAEARMIAAEAVARG